VAVLKGFSFLQPSEFDMVVSMSEKHLVAEKCMPENCCVQGGLVTSWNMERWNLDFSKNTNGLPTSGNVCIYLFLSIFQFLRKL